MTNEHNNMAEFIEIQKSTDGCCWIKAYVRISDITYISRVSNSERKCNISLNNGKCFFVETTYESLKKTIDDYYESKKEKQSKGNMDVLMKLLDNPLIAEMTKTEADKQE